MTAKRRCVVRIPPRAAVRPENIIIPSLSEARINARLTARRDLFNSCRDRDRRTRRKNNNNNIYDRTYTNKNKGHCNNMRRVVSRRALFFKYWYSNTQNTICAGFVVECHARVEKWLFFVRNTTRGVRHLADCSRTI